MSYYFVFMRVYVDESGDTGFKFSAGSSTYFTVTLVLFRNEDAATELDARIDALRSRLHLPSDYEFHFIRNSVAIRRDFLKEVRGGEFTYFALTADKRKLHGPEYNSRSSFYQAVCGTAFDSARELLKDANITFDESGGKAEKKELAAYLKRRVNQAGDVRIRKVGAQSSQGNNLIQLADMVCGAVYRSCQPEANAAEYRNIIKHREHSVLIWP